MLLRPGVDSLAVFFINGFDTTRTGMVRDEIAFVESGGRRLVRRVYQTKDRVLGARLDTLVDEAAALAPVSHHSRSSSMLEFLEFADGRVSGWVRLANGDSIRVDAPIAARIFNASTFDLVLRTSPLSENWEAEIPSFLASTRTVVPLKVKVTGAEMVDGEPAWRVQADFAGTPVTFWIGKESRRLKRQVMQLRPDRAILFSPSESGHPLQPRRAQIGASSSRGRPDAFSFFPASKHNN